MGVFGWLQLDLLFFCKGGASVSQCTKRRGLERATR
jgi:hypothetical protein